MGGENRIIIVTFREKLSGDTSHLAIYTYINNAKQFHESSKGKTW
jgi:hypothetical protein